MLVPGTGVYVKYNREYRRRMRAAIIVTIVVPFPIAPITQLWAVFCLVSERGRRRRYLVHAGDFLKDADDFLHETPSIS